MIDIYTEKIDSKDWILQNDLYFLLNYICLFDYLFISS